MLEEVQSSPRVCSLGHVLNEAKLVSPLHPPNLGDVGHWTLVISEKSSWGSKVEEFNIQVTYNASGMLTRESMDTEVSE